MSRTIQEQQPDIISELRESYKKYGPLRKVLKTQYGIACGNTRLKAIPEWPIMEKQVKDYLEHINLELADNLAESKSAEWWTKTLKSAAEFSINTLKVPREQVSVYLKEHLSVSKWRVDQFLPGEYKNPNRQKGGISAQESLAEKKEAYRKGLSPSLKQNNPSQLTLSHIKLFSLLKPIKGTNWLNEKPHLRENPANADEYTNELNKDGSPKSYQTDLVDYNLGLVVEALGKGSSSNDPNRDIYFKEHHFEVEKFDNQEIKDAPRLVQRVVELRVENLRLKKQLGIA